MAYGGIKYGEATGIKEELGFYDSHLNCCGLCHWGRGIF